MLLTLSFLQTKVHQNPPHPNPDQHGIAIKVRKGRKKRKKESSGQRQSECLLFHASPQSPRENYPAILVERRGSRVNANH